MMETVAAIVLFTLIVVTLAAIVLVVRRQLVPRQTLTIQLNPERSVSAQSGDKLLATLAANGIYLPAACGGRGSCGQCRVTISRGGGPLLPLEAAHISAAEAARGEHLACMVTLRDDLALTLPPDLLEARQWRAKVRSNHNLSPFLKELILAMPPDTAMAFDAGDYVLLQAPPQRLRFADFAIDTEYEADWTGLRQLQVEITEPTTRAYSLASNPGAPDELTLVVRIALPPSNAAEGTPPGKVSAYLFSLLPGAEVTLSGPFGDFHARESDREMILIGGGAGIAPLRSMILDQLINRRTTRKLSFWYGARNLKELCYKDEFEALAQRYDHFSYRVALSQPAPEDDWHGPIGLIHTVVYQHYLETHPAPEEAEYYLCGPPLMSSAVVAMLEDLGVDRNSILYDDFGA